MKVYNYDYDGKFVCETDADKDPEIELRKKTRKKNEPEIESVFLLPAFATFEKPPKYKEGKEFARFANGKWEVEKIKEVEPVKPVELSNVQKRRAEYPDYREYIEALAMGNEQAQKAYLDKVKNLIEKYPD